jgi:transcriptional regulator with XRE-family HTH domain
MDLKLNIRKARKAEGMSLKELGSKVNLSATYLSKLERDMANPSINTLQKIAKALNTDVRLFLETNDEDKSASAHSETAKVVRKNKRKTLVYPGEKIKAQLLTPNLRGKLEVLISMEEPTDEKGETFMHEGEEFGLILEGSYEVTVGGNIYRLEEGDSISYSAEISHSMRNSGEKNSQTLWVITPPSI